MNYEIIFILSLFIWLVVLIITAINKTDRKPLEIAWGFTTIFIILRMFFVNILLPVSEGRGVNLTNLIGGFFLTLEWFLFPIIALFVYGIRIFITSKAYLIVKDFIKIKFTSLVIKLKVIWRNVKEWEFPKGKSLLSKGKFKKDDLCKPVIILLATILVITLYNNKTRVDILNEYKQEEEIQVLKFDFVISELLDVNNDLETCESGLASCNLNLSEHSRYIDFYSKFIISWEIALFNTEKYKVVCGPVMNSYISELSQGSPLFIDIGNRYPSYNRFRLVYFPVKYDGYSLGLVRKGALYRYSEGDYLCVIGFIELYKGVPQIVIQDLSQVIAY